MDAFLITACTSWLHQGRIVESCTSSIIYGGDEKAARVAYEQGLLSTNRAENPNATKIEKLVSAPVLDQLFTETGPVALDWPQICEEAERLMQSTPPDDLAQGYWVDCDQVVQPSPLSA